MPVWLQHAAVTAKGLLLRRERYGQKFKKYYSCYIDRSSWSVDELINYREKMLSAALMRASKTPYYSRLFSSIGAQWQDFLEYENFCKLPVLNKRDLQSCIDDFRCRPPVRSDRIITTSGTTGTSLSFPVSCEVEPDQWAVWWRYRGWHGLSLKTPCALFASAPVVPATSKGTPYRINWFSREIRFSIFHISEETVDAYVDSLNRFRTPWIHGNPTAIALLASLMNARGLTLDYEVRIVTVGSENLLPWQEHAIALAFGVKPVQHYGLSEAVANISECEEGSFHVDEDYSFVEFLEDVESESYRIIGTGFSNTALSLLRYETGDLAVPVEKSCRCGRPGRLVERLDGRLTDYITLPDGQRVASLAGPFHATPGLIAAQLYQDPTGALTVRYIPSSTWSEDIQVGIEQRLRLRVGNAIPIAFEQVEHIERTARGKTKLVVSDYKV